MFCPCTLSGGDCLREFRCCKLLPALTLFVDFVFCYWTPLLLGFYRYCKKRWLFPGCLLPLNCDDMGLVRYPYGVSGSPCPDEGMFIGDDLFGWTNLPSSWTGIVCCILISLRCLRPWDDLGLMTTFSLKAAINAQVVSHVFRLSNKSSLICLGLRWSADILVPSMR